EYSDPSDRLHMAYFWANVARHFKHPSAPAAYQNAMSALQDSLAIGPTVQAQHNIIGNLRKNMRLPLEYAHGAPHRSSVRFLFIPSNDIQQSYFSDLYVCSYTPTLGALIASRLAGAQVSSDSPSLLMVGQPDAYLQGVKGEIRVVRNIGIPVTSLVSEEAT
ncbi:hypothetical protein BC826DRAFT_886360, partial [Russula brevipes]